MEYELCIVKFDICKIEMKKLILFPKKKTYMDEMSM